MKRKTIKLNHGQIRLEAEDTEVRIFIDFLGQPTAFLKIDKNKAVDLLEGLIYILEIQ